MFCYGITKTITMLVTAIMLLTQSSLPVQGQCVCTTVVKGSLALAASAELHVCRSADRSCCGSKQRCCEQIRTGCDCGCSNDGRGAPFLPKERNERSGNGITAAATFFTLADTPHGCDNGHAPRSTTPALLFASVSVQIRCCIWQT